MTLEQLVVLVNSPKSAIRGAFLGQEIESSIFDILSFTQRHYLYLCYGEGRRVDEIAKLMHVSKGYVSQELGKGKIALAQEAARRNESVRIAEGPYTYHRPEQSPTKQVKAATAT